MVRNGKSQIRRKARRALLQILYEVDNSTHLLGDSIRWVLEEAGIDKNSEDFITDIAYHVVDQHEKLDEHIEKYAPSWPVNQLAVVDRNILRIAIFELQSDSGTPVKVVVNEAVELAKRFGSDNSHRFVNGVLGSMVSAPV